MLIKKFATWGIFGLLALSMFTATAVANPMQASAAISKLRLAPMSGLPAAACHDPAFDDADWERFQFPSLKPQQYLCIRARLEVTEENIPENPALLFLALAAYEVYLDGELLGRNGVPGVSGTTEQIGAISSLLALDASQLAPGEHLISMELSSFNADASFTAIAYDMLLLDQHRFFDTINYASIITALLVGALVVAFVMFLTLFLRFNRAPSFLVFSLLCLATAALLVAEQWKLLVNYSYDLHLTRLYLIMATTLLVTVLLPGYYLVKHATRGKKFWFAALLASLMLSMLAAQSYDARSEWLFIVALLFVVGINLLALRHKKPGALAAVVISGISLLGLLFAPRLFIELGFGLSVILVLASIGVSLINQLVAQRKLALESAKLKGELLRRNLQPHYLMNCLMQVQELIDVAPKQAHAFVEQLAEEFRALVSMSNRDVVTLEQELQICRSHLKIMSVRYQQQYKLVVKYNNDGNSPVNSELLVPTAIIHSQIENCFTHNRITSNQNIELNVSQQMGATTLELSTPIDNATQHRGVGIGEAYIRAKLAQVCQPGWQLTSEAKNGTWKTIFEYVLSTKTTEIPASTKAEGL